MARKTNIKWTNLAVNGLITILIGSYFIFFSESLSKIITYVLGGSLILGGLIFILTFYTGKSKQKKPVVFNLIQGVLYLSIGIIILIKHDVMMDILMYIVGLWLIVTALTGIVYGAKLKNEIGGSSILLIISTVIAILGGSIFIFTESIKNPNIGFALGCMTAFLGLIIFFFSIPIYRYNVKVTAKEKILHEAEVNKEILKNTESEEEEEKKTIENS